MKFWPVLRYALLPLAVSCSGQINGVGRPGGEADPTGQGQIDRGNGNDGDGNAGAGDGDGGDGGDDDSAPNTTEYIASHSVARRLSRAELDNALEDLLGDDRGVASTMLPEDPGSPYDNDYTMQTASGALIESLATMAEDVATHVTGDASRLEQFLPCTPSGVDDRGCFRQTAADLLRKAFRRAAPDAEVDQYLPLLELVSQDGASAGADFASAINLLIRAVVMDPEFLYRVEVGTPTEVPGVFALNDYEIATRLSFLLWGTLPDDGLWADAQAGRLQDPAGRLTSAHRLLMDDRSKRQLNRFHAMWLGYRAVPHGPELAAAFQRETSTLINRVVFEDRLPYPQLFTIDETFIDDMLAQHYSLPLPGEETWVPYGESGRAGLLSHGSFLSAFGKFSDTSPTQRGILVRTRLLCQEVPDPPANVMADQPPGNDEAVCKQDRYAEHRNSPACAGCHAQLDPIGFGLEKFDLAGRFREHDDGLPECQIEGTGQVPPYGDFSGPAELGSLLVDSGELERCVTSQFLSFAVGRPLEELEEQAVNTMRDALIADNTQLLGLVEAYVRSNAFALRREPNP